MHDVQPWWAELERSCETVWHLRIQIIANLPGLMKDLTFRRRTKRAAQELAVFLRRNSAKRHLREEPAAKFTPRVYWHRGSEVAFFECVSHRLSVSEQLSARTTVFDYERPQHEGQALAEWTLSGDALPSIGARLRVFYLKAEKWIGSGRIEEDRDTVLRFLSLGSGPISTDTRQIAVA